MIEHWNILKATAINYQSQFQGFFESFDVPASKYKKFKELQKHWKELAKLINNFEELLSPVEPVIVKMPEANMDMYNAWQFWLDYLKEQHNYTMKSRQQLKQIKKLWEYCGESPEEFIKYIDFHINYGAKYFFKINEKKYQQEDKEITQLTKNSDF